MSLTDDIAAKYLGKKVEGCNLYNPSLLVAVPRSENRRQYDIGKDKLPFEGYDVWQAYEFSALTNNGIPVTRLLKFKYSCDSEFLIESKSLKLYLNSFNMSRFGNNSDECLQLCKEMIIKDLSSILKANVSCEFLDSSSEKAEIFGEFTDIMSIADLSNISAEHYKEAPEVLKICKCDFCKKHFLKFDSLRSNCRITHQPDFADVFIYYYSANKIDEASLIKYLISFRSEFHFHEECCEMIYKRLLDLLNVNDELFVAALYTRRGGIDISPVRSNCGFELADKLLNVSVFAKNGIKQ